MADSTDTGFAQPSEQHHWLAKHAGKWNVDCEFYMDPSQPPMKMSATDQVEMHGSFFSIGTFEGNMMGMPFRGICTLGYDPAQECFMSTWADTINPTLYYFTGNFDSSGKVLEMTARAPEPTSKQMTDWRTTEEELDADTRKFEMFMKVPGGPEIKILSHTYRRA